MAGEWRDSWDRLGDTARGAGDALRSTHSAWAQWRNRPRRSLITLPTLPPWLAEAKLLAKWKLQEWWLRIALRWAAISHPVVEWVWHRAAAAARRIDDARDKLAYRLKPLVWRIADWLERRTQAAAARRSSLVAKLAALSAMRVRPAVRAVEDRVHVAAAVRTGREFGLSPGLMLVGLLLVAGAVYLRWTMRPPPADRATDAEITMMSGFLTGSGGAAPVSNDPQAWLRAIGAAPAVPAKGAR